ncbi:MAG: sugar phosphate isomerase/epimerase [Tannerella sp.]|jgi:sugar phosphate isomerase/epimerase|nr:sugar phosphate isomerase/epimerase [Tannerella sp.]
MKSSLFTIVLMLSFATTGFSQPANKGSIGEKSRVKIGLNFYSFNSPLRDGELNIFDVIGHAASIDMECVDITGYYFPNYPQVPDDEYIYEVKRCAFRHAIDISGTGVRNDFTKPDATERKKEIRLVKDWIVVASKLGANTIRIFSGEGAPEGHTWDETAKWVAEATDECAEFGKQYGVIVAMQNHNDFLKTAEDVHRFLSLCKSDNVGLMLDIGCFRTADPYVEIEKTIHHAITWQIKETVFINGVETKTDVKKLMELIQRNNYCGYLPIEILGKGNEKERLKTFFNDLKKEIISPAARSE